MPKNLRFWSNLGLIAAAHVAIIVGLIRWSGKRQDAGGQSVMWLNGGAADGVGLEKKNPAIDKSPAPRKESKTEPLKDRDPDQDRPYLASAPSDIQWPTPTASPAPTPSPRPTPTATATAARSLKPTPKPTPKPSPKKITLAKASPKPTPKATPDKTESEQTDAQTEKKESATAIPVRDEIGEKQSKKSAATQTGTGKGNATGAGAGRAGGSTTEAQFGWYGSMLHDRFYSEWVQPETVPGAGSKNSVLVKLRIEKDGRVSNFEVVRPSGNAQLDDSVKTLANRVTHVEPLPDGLGKGDHYDVKINFELNSE